MHKGDVVDLLSKFGNCIDNSCEIDNLLNHVIMLIDHDVGSFGELLHNIFDILGKTMAMFSLNDGIFSFIRVFLG